MAPNTATSSVLVRARAGDLDAQAQLVREHQRMLRAYVAVRVGDPPVVDELAQETFLRALGALHAVPDEQALPPFLRGVARNVVHEHHRARRRENERAELMARAADFIFDRAQAPRWLSDDARLLSHLHTCLGKLTERCREIVKLRYEDDLDAARISPQVGMSHAAVRQTLCRVRQQLLACVKAGAEPSAASAE